MRRLLSYLLAAVHITRPHLTILCGIYVLLGEYLALPNPHHLSSYTFRPVLLASLIVAFGFTLNDCIDVEADKLNNTLRPIPSGRLSLRRAKELAIVLGSVCIIISLTLTTPMLLLSLVNLCFAILYSFLFKDAAFWGNICMGWLVATLLIFGGLSAGSINTKIVLASCVIFVMQCAQEILGSIKHIYGDALAGTHTTAVVIGTKWALFIFHILCVLASAIALWGWADSVAPQRFGLTAILVIVVPTIINLIIQFSSASAERKLNTIIGINKIMRFVGIILLITLR